MTDQETKIRDVLSEFWRREGMTTNEAIAKIMAIFNPAIEPVKESEYVSPYRAVSTDEFQLFNLEGELPFLVFPKDKKYRFNMDTAFYEGVLDDMRWFPMGTVNTYLIDLVTDGYGMSSSRTNKYGFTGKYGSGSVFFPADQMPDYVIEWCIANLIEKKDSMFGNSQFKMPKRGNKQQQS